MEKIWVSQRCAKFQCHDVTIMTPGLAKDVLTSSHFPQPVNELTRELMAIPSNKPVRKSTAGRWTLLLYIFIDLCLPVKWGKI